LRSLLLLTLSPFLLHAQAPTVTITGTDSISHSVARIRFNVSGPYKFARTLITPLALGSCANGGLPRRAGKAAWIQPIAPFTPWTTDMRIVVGGLQANTEYVLCPQVSADGKSWSSGASATIHTLPLPAVHPALPVPAETFDTSYPNTTTYQQLPVDPKNCNDPKTGLQGRIDQALAEQRTKDSLILIPAGETCRGNYSFNGDTRKGPPDGFVFDSSAISMSNNTIRLPNHGFKEGQQLIFSSTYAKLPSIKTANPNDACSLAGEIIPGEDYYYAHVIDANTIQLRCGAPDPAVKTPVAFLNAGASGKGQFYVVPWPRRLHNIIVRTSTPDHELPPPGTRIGPQWASKMAYLVKPMIDHATGGMITQPLLVISDGNERVPIANLRFVGIEFTTDDSTEAHTSSDPQPWGTLIYQYPQDQNIVFDRCWLHGQPEPNRYSEVNLWDGKNIAWIDSYWDNLNYYHAAFTGLAVTRKTTEEYIIGAGSFVLGTTRDTAKLTPPVSISLSGTGSGSFFNYFDMGGHFHIALPPGVTGVCRGADNCRAYTGDELGSGVENDGTGGFPNITRGNGFYVDPLYSSSASCANPVTFFGQNQPGYKFEANGKSDVELGTRFTVSAGGYFCGVRFLKPAGDPQTVHKISLWDDRGGRLASASSRAESQSGWQTVRFANPVPAKPGTYRVSYFESGGHFYVHPALWQNYSLAAGSLATVAHYVAAKGSCEPNDSFPKNWAGDIAGGAVACGTITNGKITALQNAPANGSASQYDAEGCACTLGGLGPGPYLFSNNYVEGTGIVIHHDDGGGLRYYRHDYTYRRNYFRAPFEHMWGSPVSNGMRYYTRQPLEWKSGWRIHIDGNIFDGNWAEDNPDGVFITMTARAEGTESRQGWGIQDVDIENNTFEHGPGLIYGPAYVDGGSHEVTPSLRFLFRNNLAWDLNGWLYNTYNYPTVQGSLFQGANGAEDRIIDHNSIIENTGLVGVVIQGDDTFVEGVQVTNNIFQVNGTGNCPNPPPRGGFSKCGLTNGGVIFISGPSAAAIVPPNCTAPYNGGGQATADCIFPDYRWHNNLMLPGFGTSRQDVSDWWPNKAPQANHNYIPKNGTLANQGWFSVPTAAFNSFRSGDAGTNFRLELPGAEHVSIGANMDQLEAAEGKVASQGVSAVTQTTAQVKFMAPDAAGCAVDISASDPNVISQFTRFPDHGGSRARTISLTGLRSKTVYYGRVDCQVEQPVFRFQTQ